MTAYTVGPQPQAISIGTSSDSIMLTNQGPFTLYLDNDSSVNTSSYALPPTTTTVWDRGRPLWAMSAGRVTTDSSVLMTTRNSVASDSSRAATAAILFSQPYPTSTITTPYIEVGSYNTVTLAIADPDIGDGLFPIDTHRYLVTFYYYDESTSGALIKRALRLRVQAGALANAGDLIKMTVPVYGLFLRIVVTGWSSAPTPIFKVSGTSRVLPLAIDTIGVGYSAFAASDLAPKYSERDYVCDPWTWDTVYVNPSGPYLTVNVYFPDPVTTAGFLMVRDMTAWSRNVFGLLPVAVSSGAMLYTLTCRVPMSASYLISGTAPVSISSPVLNVIHSDN